jgi:hypothetical protein
MIAEKAFMSIRRLRLPGAAILVSRGIKVLQAAPAAYPYRSATRNVAEAVLLVARS